MLLCDYTVHTTHMHMPVHPQSRPDYSGIDTTKPNAVVIGDAAEAFTYESLNHAFRILIQQPGSTLISLGKGYGIPIFCYNFVR